MENKDCLTTPRFKECKSKANNLYGFENPVTCTTDIAQLYTLEIIPAPFMGIEIRSHSPVIALTAAASPERALNLLCSPDKRAIPNQRDISMDLAQQHQQKGHYDCCIRKRRSYTGRLWCIGKAYNK